MGAEAGVGKPNGEESRGVDAAELALEVQDEVGVEPRAEAGTERGGEGARVEDSEVKGWRGKGWGGEGEGPVAFFEDGWERGGGEEGREGEGMDGGEDVGGVGDMGGGPRDS